MDTRLDHSIVCTLISTTHEHNQADSLKQSHQDMIGDRLLVWWIQNTGWASKGKSKGKGHHGKGKQRVMDGGSQTQHTVSQSNSMTSAHTHALNEFVANKSLIIKRLSTSISIDHLSLKITCVPFLAVPMKRSTLPTKPVVLICKNKSTMIRIRRKSSRNV